MIPKLISNYGGPYKNLEVVEDPETQVDEAYLNRLLEDGAQLTRFPNKAWVRFNTTVNAGPTPVAVIAGKSIWGNGSDVYPTIQKTTTGVYVITYASSFLDALGESETVSFSTAIAQIASLTKRGIARWSIAANVITINTISDPTADPLVPHDLGGGIPIDVWLN